MVEQRIYFAVKDNHYITLKKLKYDNIVIPKGFEFDGVTLKAPFTIIFSVKDLTAGIMASCFHDYMCKHKQDYSRIYATDVLVKLWENAGLNKYKAYFVKICVNIFQLFKGGWRS